MTLTDTLAVDWVRKRIGHQVANDLSEYLYGSRLIMREPGLREALQELLEFPYHEPGCGGLPYNSPCICGLDKAREKAYAALAAPVPPPKIYELDPPPRYDAEYFEGMAKLEANNRAAAPKVEDAPRTPADHDIYCGCADCVNWKNNALREDAPPRTPLRELIQKLRNQYADSFEKEGVRTVDAIALVSQLDATLRAATPESDSRGRVIEECIHEIHTGRTAVNFGHVPSVSRALDWLTQDLCKLAAQPSETPAPEEK
jgi:hypothetical protein